MSNEQPLPFGRFSPTKGIWVDKSYSAIRITGTMEMYGDDASAAAALQVQQTINSTWTFSFSDGNDVFCNVVVKYRPPGTPTGPFTQIEAGRMIQPSKWNRITKELSLNTKERDAFTWTAGHEFGHALGMGDRYSEPFWSKLSGLVGGPRTSTPHQGYEGNLMAEVNGILTSQNALDLASENQPSPYWLNDDDQTRAWIMTHQTADIRMMSTANKLKAIKVLMSGWISDADIKAIEKIFMNSKSKFESDAIKKGINLMNFTSIGQRTQMRVIMTRMP
ncbi:MAG: hypothetical protein PSX80_11265 [bacterium]|nr:hypothetical protein [bacterium]